MKIFLYPGNISCYNVITKKIAFHNYKSIIYVLINLISKEIP